MIKAEFLDPEDIYRCHAFGAAIRALARQHNVAHHVDLKTAIKLSKLGDIESATSVARHIGIPEDTLMSVRTLIFG